MIKTIYVFNVNLRIFFDLQIKRNNLKFEQTTKFLTVPIKPKIQTW